MAYGDRSKRQRKLMNKALGSAAIPPYYPLLQYGTITFLRKLIQSPADYVEHGRWYAGGLTLSVLFGYEPAPHNDKFLTLASKWLDMFAFEILNGSALWPVDLIPALRYLPSWFPGAGFKRKAAMVFSKTEQLATEPYEFTKNSVVSRHFPFASVYDLMSFFTGIGDIQTIFLFDTNGRPRANRGTCIRH